MTSPADLAEFGQWLSERQDKLLTELWKEQRQSQENLLKGLCEVLRERGTLSTQSDREASGIQYRLCKLTSEDDIEASLQTFEATTLAAKWEKPNGILGPYLSGAAQVVLKTLPVADI